MKILWISLQLELSKMWSLEMP